MCSIDSRINVNRGTLLGPQGHYLCARHCTGTMAIMKQQIMRGSSQTTSAVTFLYYLVHTTASSNYNQYTAPIVNCPPSPQSDKICKYCKQSAVGQLIISPPSHIAWIKYFLTHLNIFCFSSVDTSHVMNKYQLSYTLRRYLKYFIYKIISIITINTWKGLA